MFGQSNKFLTLVAAVSLALLSTSLVECESSSSVGVQSSPSNLRFRKTIVHDNTKEKEIDEDSEKSGFYYQIDPSLYKKPQSSAQTYYVPQNYIQQYDSGRHQQYLQQHLQQQLEAQSQPRLSNAVKTQTIYKPSNLESLLSHSRPQTQQKPVEYSPANEVSSFKYESPYVSYNNNGLISQIIAPKHQAEQQQHQNYLQSVIQQQKQQSYQNQPENSNNQNSSPQQTSAVYYMLGSSGQDKLAGSSGGQSRSNGAGATLLAIPSSLLTSASVKQNNIISNHAAVGLSSNRGLGQMIYLVQRPH